MNLVEIATSQDLAWVALGRTQVYHLRAGPAILARLQRNAGLVEGGRELLSIQHDGAYPGNLRIHSLHTGSTLALYRPHFDGGRLLFLNGPLYSWRHRSLSGQGLQSLWIGSDGSRLLSLQMVSPARIALSRVPRSTTLSEAALLTLAALGCHLLIAGRSSEEASGGPLALAAQPPTRR